MLLGLLVAYSPSHKLEDKWLLPQPPSAIPLCCLLTTELAEMNEPKSIAHYAKTVSQHLEC